MYPKAHILHILSSCQSWPSILVMDDDAKVLKRPITTVEGPRLCKLCRILLLEPHDILIHLCHLDIEKGPCVPEIEIIE